jgi:hypothetical protein
VQGGRDPGVAAEAAALQRLAVAYVAAAIEAATAPAWGEGVVIFGLRKAYGGGGGCGAWLAGCARAAWARLCGCARRGAPTAEPAIAATANVTTTARAVSNECGGAASKAAGGAVSQPEAKPDGGWARAGQGSGSAAAARRVAVEGLWLQLRPSECFCLLGEC